jgi:hypothetical protein
MLAAQALHRAHYIKAHASVPEGACGFTISITKEINATGAEEGPQVRYEPVMPLVFTVQPLKKGPCVV